MNKQQPNKWEPMELKFVGKLNELVLFPGIGKLSLPFDDMGDSPKKPKGQE